MIPIQKSMRNTNTKANTMTKTQTNLPKDSACAKLRIQLKLNTALLSTVRVSVRPFVTGVTSHISHIYKGINAILNFHFDFLHPSLI